MIHVRTDNEELNSKRRFACGLGPDLPEGDKYFFEGEDAATRHVDCPKCAERIGIEPRTRLGTPMFEISGRPGHPGYDEFKRIARSWGYD